MAISDAGNLCTLLIAGLIGFLKEINKHLE